MILQVVVRAENSVCKELYGNCGAPRANLSLEFSADNYFLGNFLVARCKAVSRVS